MKYPFEGKMLSAHEIHKLLPAYSATTARRYMQLGAKTREDFARLDGEMRARSRIGARVGGHHAAAQITVSPKESAKQHCIRAERVQRGERLRAKL